MLRIDGLHIPPCPDPISVEVAGGEAVALVDRQGAFGPRLIDLVSLTRPPRQGRVELFGTDLSKLDPAGLPRLRRRLGFVFPDLRLEGRLTAMQTLELAARAVGWPRGDYAGPCGELLRWTHLAAHAEQPVEALDPGARRRLALARALVNRPELLIAQDPAAGLAEAEAAPLLRLLTQLRDAGTAILIVVRSDASPSASLATRLAEPGPVGSAAEGHG